MTVVEALDLKARVEQAISDELTSFHRRTGLRVTDVELVRPYLASADGRPIDPTPRVRMLVTL